ncbi:MAG: T9SS type A sorting domain-containing protein [Bacteroidetes bacterium]|nr:T9SS type A sorting domain-containing protein [Bacteroidota bacterium]
MKKILLFSLALMFVCTISKAQTTAQDWTKTDCNGNTHHLFSELDSGKCIILAFDMIPSCQFCIDAANLLEPIVERLKLQYPSKIGFYCIGFVNTYTSDEMKNWETTNGFHHDALFTKGASDVAYYGGMGMPTIVVVGKNTHQVYYNKRGISFSDTSKFKTAIQNILSSSSGVEEIQSDVAIMVSPNPTNGNITIQMNVDKSGSSLIELVGLSGQIIQNIYSGRIEAGLFEKTISTAPFVSGVYFIKVTMNGASTYRTINISN